MYMCAHMHLCIYIIVYRHVYVCVFLEFRTAGRRARVLKTHTRPCIPDFAVQSCRACSASVAILKEEEESKKRKKSKKRKTSKKRKKRKKRRKRRRRKREKKKKRKNKEQRKNQNDKNKEKTSTGATTPKCCRAFEQREIPGSEDAWLDALSSEPARCLCLPFSKSVACVKEKCPSNIRHTMCFERPASQGTHQRLAWILCFLQCGTRSPSRDLSGSVTGSIALLYFGDRGEEWSHDLGYYDWGSSLWVRSYAGEPDRRECIAYIV